MDMQKTIKRELYYIYAGPAMDHPADNALYQEIHYNKDGLEIACFDVNSNQYYYYDSERRLVKEQTIDSEKVVVKDYEYSPDGELFHTRETTYTDVIVKRWPVLPNGNIDTSSDLLEEDGWVQVGDIIDEWIYYENEGKTQLTESVIHREDGSITKEVKASHLSDSMGEDDSNFGFLGYKEERDEDAEGNWVHKRLVKKDGTVALEVVRVIEYW